MAIKIDCVEEVLKRYKDKRPVCENIKRHEFLTFDHETKLGNTWLLITFWYDSMSGLTVRKIVNKKDIFKDATERYREHSNVKNVEKFFDNEIKKSFENASF